MPVSKTLALGLVTLVLLGGCASAPGEPRAAAGSITGVEHPQRLAKLAALSDAVLVAEVDDERPGCSAAVGVRGSVVWAGAAGLADLGTGAPLTTDTRFEVASIAKQFTAAAILLLEHDGLLSLDDPLARSVDGLPGWADDVTLDDLVHHTAGVPEFWMQLAEEGIGFSDPADQATTLAAIARETELDSGPGNGDGDGHRYSNSHYVLLAEVVERVSGQPFAVFLAERIFDPLSLDLAVAPGATGPDIATPYEIDLTPVVAAWTAVGHAGILGTPSELVRWGDQYRLGEIARGDAVLADIEQGAVDDGEGERYGAGIRITDDGSLYHSGRWGGSVSDFRVSADRETVVAVTCTVRGANRFEIADALQQLWGDSP